ncbi:hypothetical protein [Flexivirga caeni]|uniref:Uncharacterized protein n=1 Tax=Flexivirga caeni TaxID=2294115 RepID=A0A3M9MBH0_9MICO|nr:hypothetical protein [Flexivirga caeni]RNI22203.1 hypothetical protein EFY87_09500 [Flexivirga caeni]
MRTARNRTALISAAVFVVLVLILVGAWWLVHRQDTRRVPQFVKSSAESAERSAQFVDGLPPPPAAHRDAEGCDVLTWEPAVTGGKGGTVTVDPGPSGAVVYWLPGSQSTSCRVRVTKLTEAQADSLATDVRKSTSHGGRWSCPADDGSAAWIFFRYADRPRVEVVDAALSGCLSAGAPGRDSVGPFWRGADALTALRPAGE